MSLVRAQFSTIHEALVFAEAIDINNGRVISCVYVDPERSGVDDWDLGLAHKPIRWIVIGQFDVPHDREVTKRIERAVFRHHDERMEAWPPKTESF